MSFSTLTQTMAANCEFLPSIKC